MSIQAHIDPRELDQLVTFQRDVATRSATGDKKPNWSTLASNVRAKVDGARGREFAAGGATVGQAGYTVWVYADIVTRFSIRPKDRIVWDGIALNITDVPNQQLRGRFMAVICSAGVNAG